MLYVKPTREVTLQTAQKGLNEELAGLASDGITSKELQRIKKVSHLTRAAAFLGNDMLCNLDEGSREGDDMLHPFESSATLTTFGSER